MGPPFDIRERTRLFAGEVYRFARAFRVAGPGPAHLADQAARAAASVGANLEEARDAESKRDFISKNSIALKEARETRYWLRLARETEPATSTAAAPLLAESEELIAILTTIVKKAKANGEWRTRTVTETVLREKGKGRRGK